MEKKYRVIQTTICEQHKRVSVYLVDAAELDPRNIIKPNGHQMQMRQLPDGKMVYLAPLATINVHNHRGHIFLDLTSEEYENLGSPTVGQTVETVFKAGK